MTRSQRVAIARIFADLIKADRIIDVGEMEYWSKICNKYSIDKDIEVEAQKVAFSDALDAICNSEDTELPANLLADCRAMTVSDGFCAHSEALIMIALMLMLDSSQPLNVTVYSIPRASFNIDVATALYVESYPDPATNEAICRDYRSIFKELQLAGFHFVYPPKIIEHYRETPPDLFRQILSFLAPSLSPDGIESAYRSLMNMTTDVFCKDLLCNKCGISDLRDTYPSLMIKIGNSFVGEVPYANYLKIEVDENILATVQGFVDNVCDMLSSDVYVVNTSEERDSQFHFHGFYKQLLDIFLIRKNIRSRIIIDPYKGDILFPDVDAEASKLNRRERALYALLLCCGSDGLNFNRPTTSSDLSRYNRRLEKIQARYRTIYAIFGGDATQAPDLGEPTIRRPIFSRLRKSICNVPSLYNPDDYNISTNSDGTFAVNVDENLVFVRDLDSPDPVPLKESALYRRVMKA